jgi:hypothetical protein
MATTMLEDTTCTLAGSAVVAYNEAEALIRRAREWATDLDDLREETSGDLDAMDKLMRERAAKVDEMQASFYENLARVIFGLRATSLSRDGEACMFWRGSGMVGGLVYHSSFTDEGRTRLPVGTWSLHT